MEKTYFRAGFDDIWNETRGFFTRRDPTQLAKAEPRSQASHGPGLPVVSRAFRSRWANGGEPSRAMDYQVWCGPAMGAFNEWTKGSYLEAPANRKVVDRGEEPALWCSACSATAVIIAAQAWRVTAGGVLSQRPVATTDELERRLSHSGTWSSETSQRKCGECGMKTKATRVTCEKRKAVDSAFRIPHSEIAIIGIGCLFPKAAGFGHSWANIKNGVDGITEVPATHWNPADYFDADPKSPDRTYARRGGFLDAVDFNPIEWSLPPKDLEATDTSQLLGLIAAKMARLNDAGVDFHRPNPKPQTPNTVEETKSPSSWA